MANARKERGRDTELIAAKYYKERLWPNCKANAPSAPGKDLLNTPLAAVEIKARSSFHPNEWARQAIRNASKDETPMVLMRPVGMGPESIDSWPMFMPNKFFVELWKRAYGGGGSRRAVKRSHRLSNSKDHSHWYSFGVGPESNHSSDEVLQAVVSAVLHGMGFEPGQYEMEIRRVKGGSSATELLRETHSARRTTVYGRSNGYSRTTTG